MGKLYNSGSPTSKVYNVSLNAPFDTRLTVQNVADLTNGENGGIASLVYRGMVVYVHQDKSLYIYTGASNGTWKNKNTGKLINGGDINNWKKLIVDPVDALEFYEGIFTKKEELADFLTSSDLEDYVKVEDITNITSGFVSQSDLDVYVKTTDLVDFVKSEDIKDFAKKEDLNDFLTSSDVSDFVKVDELDTILSEDVFSKFVSQSDLDVYVKSEDLTDFVTSSELDARIAAIDIPEVPKNVSVFFNDAGYLTETDLPDFLLASDLDGYVKTSDLEAYIPKTELEKLATKSDLKDYVKAEDAIEYLTSSDLDGYLKVSELPTNVSAFHNDAGYLTENTLPDFLTASDVEDFISVDELNGVLADYVSQSDLDVYVKTKDVINYIEQNGDFVKSDEIKNFLEASDVADFITVDQVNEILTEKGIDDFVSQSDLTVYVNRSELVNYVTSSELNNYAPLKSIPTKGMFPAESDVDIAETVVDGYATVQDVMNYVNALIEKKKDELVKPDYLYTNGYRRGDAAIELNDPLNEYEIVLDSNGEFVIELLHKNEEDGWYDIEDPTGSYYGTYFKIILPNDYDVKVYLWDDVNNDYNSNEAKIADPAYSLIAEDVTPDNTTYYYKDAVEGFLFSGAKGNIESTISQTYNNHLLKLIITKKK